MRNLKCLAGLLPIVWLFSVVEPVQAQSVCSQTEVQSAINAASSGGTVTLTSPCNVTWASSVIVPNTKGITLNGNGATINGEIILLQKPSMPSRVTGFTFTRSSLAVQTWGAYTSAACRIDHNTFSYTSSAVTFIELNGNAPCLIDHNSFTGGAASEMIHNIGMGPLDSSGWLNDVTPGGATMVFIEDNTFTYTPSGTPAFYFGTSAVQSYYGARTVFRYNTCNDCQIDQHGTAGSIGARWWEIYNNTFNNASQFSNQANYIVLRAGSGVVFNNHHSGFANLGTGSISLYEEDTGAWPLAYQVGSGINGNTDQFSTCAGGTRNTSPAYIWGNDLSMQVSTGSGVQLNREVFSSASQPASLYRGELGTDTCTTTYSYSPYTYPHPLTSPDTGTPSIPTNLAATAFSAVQVNLSWTASTDDVGVEGYNIFRNGTQVGTATTTSYQDTGLFSSTTYSYTISAFDFTGNNSAQSAPVHVTTLAIMSPPAITSQTSAIVTADGAFVYQITATNFPTAYGAGGLPAGLSINTATGVISGTPTTAGTLVITLNATNIIGPGTATLTLTVNPAPDPGSAITYIQGAYATPQSAQTAVSATFPAGQTVGDLNVVVVGWNDSTATVTAVTDTSGNLYKLAVGPTTQLGTASQSIYYAVNIAASALGANVVTVQFSTPAIFPDIRIAEYQGADPNNPVDVTSVSSGNSSTSSSGTATTTNPVDLIFGANLVQTATAGPGTGFKTRILSASDGDISEDEMVSTVGSYSASAPLNLPGPWIMQMVAFRTAAGPAATISATAGTPQSAAVNARFAIALAAAVKDAHSNPVSGVTVTFTATTSGAGGTFAGSGSTVAVTTTTSGVATAPIFTANGATGSYTVTATVSGVGTPINFSLTNTPALPASITASGGSSQSTVVTTSFGTALTAAVRDTSNNLLSGVSVSFVAPSSGASGTFTGGGTTVTAITTTGGVATAPTFTANTKAGAYTVTATVTGLGGPANFSMTNNAGPAASITATAPIPQSVTVNSSFGNLAATVNDANSNPVSGVSVTFTAPASGASGTFTGGTAGGTIAAVMTNNSGLATAPVFTANTKPGAYTVTATVLGLGAPANFSLTNNAGPPASITAANGTTPQNANVSSSFAVALAAAVNDASGNPLSGLTVTFTAPASGASGTFTGGSGGGTTVTVVTTSGGVATAPTFTANGTPGTYPVKATVSGVVIIPANFNLTNIDTTPPTVSITAPTAGSAVSGTITVSATASDNVGVVGVQFKLDGATLGLPQTTTPYSISWDTTTVSNGSHSLTAVAQDTAGNQATASSVTVTVSNKTSTGGGGGGGGVGGGGVGGGGGGGVAGAPTGTTYVAAAISTPSNGGQALTTGTGGASVTMAYASLQEDSLSSLSGVAIFAYSKSGIIVSETGVPATAAVTSGRIYVNVNGAINTGIAFANPNPLGAVLSFYFTDSSGITLSQGSFLLDGYSQIAAFLNQGPFYGPAPMEGTFTFTSTGPVGAIALRGFTNERGDFLMSTLPVSSLAPTPVANPLADTPMVSPVSSSPASTPVLLPHFADGGGWTTQIILTNLYDSPVKGNLQFFGPGTADQAGPVLSISVNGVTNSSFSYTIQARSSVRLVTGNSTSYVQVGSVQLISSDGMTPAMSAVFSFKDNGVTVTEAGVSAAPTGTAFRVYAEISNSSTTSIQTGLALANPSAMPVKVSVEVLGMNGSSTLPAITLTLPASGQLVRFVGELFPNLNAPFHGFLKFTASAPIGVSGLRTRYNQRNDFLISTTPARDDNQLAILGSGLVFPDVVGGGGYTTQIIIYGGASETGSLWFGSFDPTVLSLTTY